jgi:FkbM family methyltransferase
MRTSVKNFLAYNPRLDALFRRHIWSRIHFSEMEMKFLDGLSSGSIDIAIDVGAALGPYSWILARKSRKVFAFEPGAHHGTYLQANVGGTNVTLVRAAVGASAGTVNLYTPGSDKEAFHTATLSLSNPVASVSSVMVKSVPQVALDEYFADNLAIGDRVDIIKIDVEGYENEVFVGAKNLIRRHLPLVICEIEARHNSEYIRSFSLLRSLGYTAYVFEKGKYLPFDGDDIGPMQQDAALAERLSGKYDPATNAYLNNFVFQHDQTRIKVTK